MSYEMMGLSGEVVEVVSIEAGMQKPMGPIGVLAFKDDPTKCDLIDPGYASEFGGNFLEGDAVSLLKKQIVGYGRYSSYTGFHIIDITKLPHVRETLYTRDICREAGMTPVREETEYELPKDYDGGTRTGYGDDK